MGAFEVTGIANEHATGYTGRSNGSDILEVTGTLPVVLSAPHAVRCGLKSKNKYNNCILALSHCN
jgi:hypothetical protein